MYGRILKLRVLFIVAGAFIIALALASSAQAYKQIGSTDCILRATAPIDIYGGDNPSKPWWGAGEVDCSSSHFISLNVTLYQLLANTGWTPIFSSSNTKDVNAERIYLHSFVISYLTKERWYCTRAGGTVGSGNLAQATVYRSRSIMVNRYGIHYGTC